MARNSNSAGVRAVAAGSSFRSRKLMQCKLKLALRIRHIESKSKQSSNMDAENSEETSVQPR